MANYMYDDLAAREYSHGRALREAKREHELKLNELVETLRGQNSARVAQINADVGMAEIAAKKPYFTAEAEAISSLIPYKVKGAEQDVELGELRNKLANIQFEREPELYRRKLEGLDLDALTKRGILAAELSEYADDENFPQIATGILPESILENFRKNKKSAVPMVPTEVTPTGWRQNPLIRTASYLLPVTGTALGALAGSTLAPGVGTYVGGATGGMIGEYGRQKLLGEELSPLEIGLAGIGGAAGAKYANRGIRSVLSRNRTVPSFVNTSQGPIPQPASSYRPKINIEKLLEERRFALPPAQYSRWR